MYKINCSVEVGIKFFFIFYSHSRGWFFVYNRDIEHGIFNISTLEHMSDPEAHNNDRGSSTYTLTIVNHPIAKY